MGILSWPQVRINPWEIEVTKNIRKNCKSVYDRAAVSCSGISIKNWEPEFSGWSENSTSYLLCILTLYKFTNISVSVSSCINVILILPFLILRITVKFNFHSYQGLQLIDPITFLIIHHHSAILYSFLIQSCSVTCHYNYSLSYALLLLPIRLAKPPPWLNLTLYILCTCFH